MNETRQVEVKSTDTGSQKRVLKSIGIVTIFTLGAQIVGFVTQILIAAIFGAQADMDAFLAASTLPQYVTAVLLSALGFVFIPVFVEYAAAGNATEAWKVASTVLTLCTLLLACIAGAGILFARPLLVLSAPGLAPDSLDLAVHVARITWPAIVATGLVSLLTGIYQSQHRFGWPSAVPMLGALANLTLIAVLARPLGVVGVAVGAAASLLLQAVLLMPIGHGAGRFRLSFDWRHPGVVGLFRLLTPLVLSGLLIRWTPIIDRFLASELPGGTISQLGYAFKLVSLAAMLVSSGITTVIFLRMAENAATNDIDALRGTLSSGMRLMWLVLAPAIALGFALALPLIQSIYLRGAFLADDATSVAFLFQIYMLALAAMCLGNLTGRTFYALKETRIIAIVSVFEALAYAIYTPLLAAHFGAAGVALGFVFYYDLGLLWHLVFIRYKLGNSGGRQILLSSTRIGLAALCAGTAAWLAVHWLPNSWGQLLAGAVTGAAVYACALLLFRSPEGIAMLAAASGWLKSRRTIAAALPR